jgi:poly(hydroxyalkanoate) granule-associated protein
MHGDAMSKNLKELEQEEEALSRAVRSSAQQIWQAGLGAFAKAQQEGGRAFTRLVRDGSELQKRARQVEDATDTVARKAERASRRASGSWGKLEQVFEERVARALATIGVPARSEVEALQHRIDELERTVAALASGLASDRARPAAAKSSAARKPAAKRSAAPKDDAP